MKKRHFSHLVKLCILKQSLFLSWASCFLIHKMRIGLMSSWVSLSSRILRFLMLENRMCCEPSSQVSYP